MADAENPHAGQGTVVLDIGGDIGALVISTPAEMAGVEIEICPTGAPDEGVGWCVGQWRSPHQHSDSESGVGHHHHDDHEAWPHVAVLARPSPAGVQHAAVYPGLKEGSYDLWMRPDEPTALTVSVTGAEVTTVTWP